MTTFKQFLIEMDDLDFFVRMMEKASDMRPPPRVDAYYDGTQHYGIGMGNVRTNTSGDVFIDYMAWSNDNTLVPATLSIHREDIDGFTIEKDVEGKPTLVYHKP